MHAQSAVATLQLILIATRGHRAYKGPELDIIYKDVGRQFFVHLEAMSAYLERKRFAAAEQRHASAVPNTRAPVHWRRAKRCVLRITYTKVLRIEYYYEICYSKNI